ncbi:hypothetical protein V5F53_21230 [Xanthobacter sp. V4C-4]|uniref:hypothetical protein n=1 Tax=Xanthobacter cornucopiae TaxID=3119924 RepID=UPI0037266EA6
MWNSRDTDSVLFNGADIVVRQHRNHPGDTLVICFSGRNGSGKWQTAPVEQVTGPSEAFLGKNKIPAIFFYGRWNHWWQTPEMDEVIDRLWKDGILSRYRTVVTYGMSMGGYGALMFSSRLGARRVLAGMPQYSLDTARVPGETRWANDRARVTFRYDDMEEGLIKSGDVAVFFDPLFRPDRTHVDHLRKHRPITALPVPFAIHGLGSALNDMGILSSSIVTMLLKGPDQPWFRRRVRAHRHTSPLYLNRLARALAKRPGPRSRDAAIRADAVALRALEGRIAATPDYLERATNAIAATSQIISAATLLKTGGRFEEGVALMRAWAERLPEKRVRPLLLAIAGQLFTAGDTAGGAAALARVITLPAPASRDTLQAIIRLIGERGGVAEALAFDRQHGHRLLGEEALALQFGELLNRLGCHRDAARHFRLARANAPALSRANYTRRRVLGLAAAGWPAEARALARELLPAPGDAASLAELEALLAQRLADGPAEGAFPDAAPRRSLTAALRDLMRAGTPDAFDAFDAAHAPEVLRSETLSVRLGLLLAARGRTARAITYLRDCAGGLERHRVAFAQRRILALLRCQAPDAAQAVLDARLNGADDAKVRADMAQRIQRFRPRPAPPVRAVTARTARTRQALQGHGLLTRLRRLAQDAGASAGVDAIRAFDDQNRARLLRSEVLAVRFGLLAAARGLGDRATLYLLACAPGPERHRVAFAQRRILGLLALGLPDAAQTVLETRLGGADDDAVRAAMAQRIAAARTHSAGAKVAKASSPPGRGPGRRSGRRKAPRGQAQPTPQGGGLLTQILRLEQNPSVETIAAFDDKSRARVLAHEVLSVRFGLLAATHGLGDRAAVYLRACAPGLDRHQVALARRRVLGLIALGLPQDAQAVLDARLPRELNPAVHADLEARIAQARAADTRPAPPLEALPTAS